MNTSLRKQLTLFAIRAAVVIIMSALINGYLITRIRNQQEKIEDKKIVIAQLSLQEEKLSELKKEFNDVIGAKFTLEDSLPGRLDPRPFRNKVLDLAKETGNKATLALGSETALASPYPGIYMTLFSLTIEGTLASTTRFLESLKAFDHFVVVSELQMSGNPDITAETATTLRSTIYLK